MTVPGIDLRAGGAESEMRLTFQRRHDAEWTERQRRGWELELGKLEALLPPHREPARTI